MFALGKGENKFTITAFDDQLITSVKFFATGGIVDDVRQVRIDGIESIAAVPEPSTWAMMILGFAGVGFISYRRKSRRALKHVLAQALR